MNISGNIIYVRDVIKRFEELETELQEAHDGDNEKAPPFSDWVMTQKEGTDEDDNPPLQDEADEYLLLQDLLENLASRGGDEEWRGSWYPITLVADSYFVQHAQEEAESMGLISSDLSWPACHIDWDAAADALKQDYSSVTFDGDEYWYR